MVGNVGRIAAQYIDRVHETCSASVPDIECFRISLSGNKYNPV